jgi:hypothetical protein
MSERAVTARVALTPFLPTIASFEAFEALDYLATTMQECSDPLRGYE